MSSFLASLSFAAPWVFLLLPLPLLVWKMAPPYRVRVPAIRVPFFQRISERLGLSPRAGAIVRRRQLWQHLLGALIWILILSALARPQLEGEAVTLQKPARDLILAVDISGSMAQEDFMGAGDQRLQRLAGVKSVLADFLQGREGERISLIVFGSKAFVQAPLTTDLDTVLELLRQTEVGMAGPHTALGDAIGLAIRQFESSEVKQRLLILLSDGSDTASRMSPINAASIANQRDVKILTVGVGDPQGESENRLDEATLKAIAQRTGGNFYFANDQQALTQIYKEIDALVPKKVDSETYRPRTGLSHWPLGIALLLSLLGLALTLQRGGRNLQAAST
ncbi:VWA domain-containing protein [Microbulbifer agarilyticus]|uniref:VWA domain-containing protein n=1 Tax=Microbulbifer agarilyticus TaxID=260552 RepID=UPI001CD7FB1B|nr:VWA domain-containing protein [Microbulbifer agarilyticus]MCA0901150.1 VWA domain-containing protein [Microbulbifer agarilyticus]